MNGDIMVDFYFHLYTFSPFSIFFYDEHILLILVPKDGFTTYKLCFLGQLS